MLNLLTYSFLLFADAAPVAPTDGGGNNSPFPMMMLLLGGVIFFFFVMSMPQKREKKRWNDMVEALKKNDRVLMSCGIIGKVHSVQKEKNEIVIKIDDDGNTKMTFNLGALSRILAEPTKEGGSEK